MIRRTGAQLLHGAQQLDRIVRWVHTSELAEVPTLLKGGELLLTSGLGVAAHGPAAQATYVQQLADKRIAALALELGWSFDEVPAALLDAARERDLPLIALHNVVPFVEITEEIQRRIVFGQAGELSAHHELQAVLNAALLRAEGLTGIVRALAQALGCEVVLRAVSGRVVATTALERPSGEYASAPVSVLGDEWGTLCVYTTPETSAAKVRAALEHGPTAIALTLLRTGRAVPLRQRLTRELLDDLLAGRFMSSRDLEVRAGLLGLVRSRNLAGVAVGDYLPEQAEAAVHALEDAGGGLVAEVGTVLLGVVTAAGGREAAQSQAEALLEHVQARLRTGAPRLALGPAVEELDALGQSLDEARRTLLLARELGTANRAATARGMAAERLLAKLAGDGELAAFVDDEVGALLRYDALHGTDLAGTLWTCLASGASKSGIAKSLHLRRQSLYQRLAKIEQLVGPIDEPDRRVALTLALKAHQLRD